MDIFFLDGTGIFQDDNATTLWFEWFRMHETPFSHVDWRPQIWECLEMCWRRLCTAGWLSHKLKTLEENWERLWKRIETMPQPTCAIIKVQDRCELFWCQLLGQAVHFQWQTVYKFFSLMSEAENHCVKARLYLDVLLKWNAMGAQTQTDA